MKKLTIGIIVRSKPGYLETFMQSMRSQTFQDFEIVCRDNTGGKNRELIESQYPEIIYTTGDDLGFTGSHNALYAESQSELYLCSNASGYFASDYLEKLVQSIDRIDSKGNLYAAACGKLYRWDYTFYKETQDLASSFTDQIDTIGHQLLPNLRVTDMAQGLSEIEAQEQWSMVDRDSEVFGASGCSVLYRRSFIDSTNDQGYLFDPNIFMYKEDVELDWRIAAYGGKCIFVHDAIGYYDRTASNIKGQGYWSVFRNRLGRNKSHGNTSRSALHQEYILRAYYYSKKPEFSGYIRMSVMKTRLLSTIFIHLFEPATKAVLKKHLPRLLSHLPKVEWRIPVSDIQNFIDMPQQSLAPVFGNRAGVSIISRVSNEKTYMMMTQQCFPALLASQTENPLDIVVVKNSDKKSPWWDELRTWIEQNNNSQHRVRLVENAWLRKKWPITSYPDAHNYGQSLMQDVDYRICLNIDVLVHPGSIQKMINSMNEKKEVGIMGPKVQMRDNRWEIVDILDTPRAFPDIIAQVANKSNTVKRMFYSRWEKYVMDDFDHSQSQQVDWVCGHMFIMRSDLWDRIGGLDTDYFMYMTDAQMSKDTLALGYKTYYNASIAVDIIREASSKAIRPIDIFKKVLVRQHVVDALLYYWKN